MLSTIASVLLIICLIIMIVIQIILFIDTRKSNKLFEKETEMMIESIQLSIDKSKKELEELSKKAKKTKKTTEKMI